MFPGPKNIDFAHIEGWCGTHGGLRQRILSQAPFNRGRLISVKNPLVYVLVFASALASFLGDKTEAIIIVTIMLINA